jgi:hypothetical protein
VPRKGVAPFAPAFSELCSTDELPRHAKVTTIAG